MTYYFDKGWVEKAKHRKNVLLIAYFVVLAAYAVVFAGCLLWYKTLPYQSSTITVVKAVHYSVTGVFVVFSFIYLAIPFWRARANYMLVKNMEIGKKDKYTGRYEGTNNFVQDVSKVDMKSVRFSIYNKYKNEEFERKVLVFADLPFPELESGSNYDFYTQSNVLICYEKHEEKKDESNSNGNR